MSNKNIIKTYLMHFSNCYKCNLMFGMNLELELEIYV